MCGKYFLTNGLLLCLLTGISFGGDLQQTKNDIIALIKSGQTETAKESTAKLINDNSNNTDLPEALYWIARNYGWSSQYDEEKSIYQQIILNYPNSSKIGKARLGYSRAEVQSLIVQRKYNEAKKAYDKLVADFNGHPDLADTLYGIALRYGYSNRYEEEKETSQRIIEKYPNSEIANKAQFGFLKAQIQCLIASKNYKQANSYLGKLVTEFSNHPDLPDALYWIARRYEWLNKYIEAESIFEQIAQKYPDNSLISKAQLGIRRINVCNLIISNQLTTAQSDFNDMIINYPGSPDLADTIYEIGRRYEWSNKYEQAINTYQLIATRYSGSTAGGNIQLDISRANISSLIVAGQMEAAQAEVNDLKVNFADNADLPDVLYRIGERCVQQDRYEYAKNIFQHIIQTYTGSSYASDSKLGFSSAAILSIIEANDYNEATAAFDKMIEDFNEHRNLSETVFGIAEKCYDKGYKLGVKDGTGGKLLGLAAEMLNKDVLERICGQDNLAWAYYLAATTNFRLGDSDKTIEYADKVLQLDPNFKYASNMQWVIADGFEKLKASGQLPAAEADLIIEEEYKKLMENYSNGLDSFAAMRLGEIYMKQDRIMDACACFGWYLMKTGTDECGAAHINKLFEKCGRCKK